MSAHCRHTSEAGQHRYRNVLWIVLAINAAMFVLELVPDFASGSVSLQADARDFLGDAANDGISLFVDGTALQHRACAALLKGAWLCSRNDVIGSCAALFAAAGGFGTAQGWPDFVVAIIMSILVLQGAWALTTKASRELAGVRA